MSLYVHIDWFDRICIARIWPRVTLRRCIIIEGSNFRLSPFHCLSVGFVQVYLILYYKIFNGLIAIDSTNYFNSYNAITSSRTSSPKLIKPVKGSISYFNSFFNRLIDCYNSLPHNVKHCNSLSLFKKLINSIDFTRYLTIL